MPAETTTDELLDQKGVARLLGVKPSTVAIWNYNGPSKAPGAARLPRPDYVIGGRSCWRRTTIEAWAKATNRWKHVRRGRRDNVPVEPSQQA